MLFYFTQPQTDWCRLQVKSLNVMAWKAKHKSNTVKPPTRIRCLLYEIHKSSDYMYISPNFRTSVFVIIYIQINAWWSHVFEIYKNGKKLAAVVQSCLFLTRFLHVGPTNLEARVLLQRWKANPGLTLPARPRLCSMLVLDAHTVA